MDIVRYLGRKAVDTDIITKDELDAALASQAPPAAASAIVVAKSMKTGYATTSTDFSLLPDLQLKVGPSETWSVEWTLFCNNYYEDLDLRIRPRIPASGNRSWALGADALPLEGSGGALLQWA